MGRVAAIARKVTAAATWLGSTLLIALVLSMFMGMIDHMWPTVAFYSLTMGAFWALMWHSPGSGLGAGSVWAVGGWFKVRRTRRSRAVARAQVSDGSLAAGGSLPMRR